MFKLFANFIRESRERKCCGCHCVRERVRASPKPSVGRENCISSLGRENYISSLGGEFRDTGNELGYSGKLTTISVEDIRDGAVEDIRDGMVGDIRDGAFASRSSSSVVDSGNMEEFIGEEGDGFLQEAVQIKSGSSSVGNFAKKLVHSSYFSTWGTGGQKLFRDKGENVNRSGEAGFS